MEIPFDPLRRAEEVEKIVMKNLKRKYYRFRYARYYGGIVTADACGCCFLCAYCWNYFRNLNPRKYGEFYSSEEVANKLVKISEKKNCLKFRVSGTEPILGEKSLEHLVKVIDLLYQKIRNLEFVIETNGLILGFYPELVEKLQKFKDFLYVRVSIKGWNEKSFEKISGVSGKYFVYPLIAIKNLLDNRINAWPAVMWEIFRGRGIENLSKRLKEYEIRPEELEIEYLEKYPFVIENLRRRGIII